MATQCGTGSGCFDLWFTTICDIPWLQGHDSKLLSGWLNSLISPRLESTRMLHCTVPWNIARRLRLVWDQNRPTYHWQITNARTTTTFLGMRKCQTSPAFILHPHYSHQPSLQIQNSSFLQLPHKKILVVSTHLKNTIVKFDHFPR